MFEYIINKSSKTGLGRENILITVGGMISSGKSTMTGILAEELNLQPYYENVDNNDILPLFYTASDKEKEKKRYPFLLQLDFLNSRYDIIKEAMYSEKNVIIDRSIYEDWYFAKKNTEIGDISEQEFKIYEKLLENMMQEIEHIPKKAPDLMIYLKASFEEIMRRIGMRGRDFEQDEELESYYRVLWEGYDDWVYKHYDKSNVLVIDMDVFDIKNNLEDRDIIVEKVKEKIKELKDGNYTESN